MAFAAYRPYGTVRGTVLCAFHGIARMDRPASWRLDPSSRNVVAPTCSGDSKTILGLSTCDMGTYTTCAIIEPRIALVASLLAICALPRLVACAGRRAGPGPPMGSGLTELGF